MEERYEGTVNCSCYPVQITLTSVFFGNIGSHHNTARHETKQRENYEFQTKSTVEVWASSAFGSDTLRASNYYQSNQSSLSHGNQLPGWLIWFPLYHHITKGTGSDAAAHRLLTETDNFHTITWFLKEVVLMPFLPKWGSQKKAKLHIQCARLPSDTVRLKGSFKVGNCPWDRMAPLRA